MVGPRTVVAQIVHSVLELLVIAVLSFVGGAFNRMRGGWHDGIASCWFFADPSWDFQRSAEDTAQPSFKCVVAHDMFARVSVSAVIGCIAAGFCVGCCRLPDRLRGLRGAFVYTVLATFAFCVGWGTYMSMGSGSPPYEFNSRVGVFDWLTGRVTMDPMWQGGAGQPASGCALIGCSNSDNGQPPSKWRFFGNRREMRDLVGMSLRGLMQTAPAGLALHLFAGLPSTAPMWAGLLMGPIYYAGHWWPSFSGFEFTFDPFGAVTHTCGTDATIITAWNASGTPISEFMFGALLMGSLLCAVMSDRRSTGTSQHVGMAASAITACLSWLTRCLTCGLRRPVGRCCLTNDSCCSCCCERAVLTALHAENSDMCWSSDEEGDASLRNRTAPSEFLVTMESSSAADSSRRAHRHFHGNHLGDGYVSISGRVHDSGIPSNALDAEQHPAMVPPSDEQTLPQKSKPTVSSTKQSVVTSVHQKSSKWSNLLIFAHHSGLCLLEATFLLSTISYAAVGSQKDMCNYDQTLVGLYSSTTCVLIMHYMPLICSWRKRHLKSRYSTTTSRSQSSIFVMPATLQETLIPSWQVQEVDEEEHHASHNREQSLETLQRYNNQLNGALRPLTISTVLDRLIMLLSFVWGIFVFIMACFLLAYSDNHFFGCPPKDGFFAPKTFDCGMQ